MVMAVSTASLIALSVALPLVLVGVIGLFRSTPSAEVRGGVPGSDSLINYGGTAGGSHGGGAGS